eukprot:GILK01012321.1.p1 GENE.GILK01012321.1~~GILK01012321.1.p1  ORF type:complete len:1504 (-),score=211.49 GILK01012321.1:81-4238(-)
MASIDSAERPPKIYQQAIQLAVKSVIYEASQGLCSPDTTKSFTCLLQVGDTDWEVAVLREKLRILEERSDASFSDEMVKSVQHWGKELLENWLSLYPKTKRSSAIAGRCEALLVNARWLYQGLDFIPKEDRLSRTATYEECLATIKEQTESLAKSTSTEEGTVIQLAMGHCWCAIFLYGQHQAVSPTDFNANLDASGRKAESPVPALATLLSVQSAVLQEVSRAVDLLEQRLGLPCLGNHHAMNALQMNDTSSGSCSIELERCLIQVSELLGLLREDRYCIRLYRILYAISIENSQRLQWVLSMGLCYSQLGYSAIAKSYFEWCTTEGQIDMHELCGVSDSLDGRSIHNVCLYVQLACAVGAGKGTKDVAQQQIDAFEQYRRNKNGKSKEDGWFGSHILFMRSIVAMEVDLDASSSVLFAQQCLQERLCAVDIEGVSSWALQHGVLEAFDRLVTLFWLRGNSNAADYYIRQGIRLSGEVGLYFSLHRWLSLRAQLWVERGQWKHVAEVLETLHEEDDDVHNALEQSNYLLTKARWLVQEKEYSKATACLEAAESALRSAVNTFTSTSSDSSSQVANTEKPTKSRPSKRTTTAKSIVKNAESVVTSCSNSVAWSEADAPQLYIMLAEVEVARCSLVLHGKAKSASNLWPSWTKALTLCNALQNQSVWMVQVQRAHILMTLVSICLSQLGSLYGFSKNSITLTASDGLGKTFKPCGIELLGAQLQSLSLVEEDVEMPLKVPETKRRPTRAKSTRKQIEVQVDTDTIFGAGWSAGGAMELDADVCMATNCPCTCGCHSHIPCLNMLHKLTDDVLVTSSRYEICNLFRDANVCTSFMTNNVQEAAYRQFLAMGVATALQYGLMSRQQREKQSTQRVKPCKNGGTSSRQNFNNTAASSLSISSEACSSMLKQLPVDLVLASFSYNQVQGEFTICRFCNDSLSTETNEAIRLRQPLNSDTWLTLDQEFKTVMQDSRNSFVGIGDIHSSAEKSRWWGVRTEIDSRLGSWLASMESSCLGIWKRALQPRKTYIQLNISLVSLVEELGCMLEGIQGDSSCTELLDLWLGLAITDTEFPAETLVTSLLHQFMPSTSRTSTMSDLVPKVVSWLQATKDKLLSDQTEKPKTKSKSVRSKKPAATKTVSPVMLESTTVLEPLVLLLDRHVQSFPWENLPSLLQANRTITRLPNIHLLADRMKTVHETGAHADNGVDPRNTFYLLNPQGDLASTQQAFQELFERQPTWTGLSATVPTVEQYQEALSKDLFIYCGHNGGEQFVSEDRLCRLQCRATVLLMGCSSGLLRHEGNFEPYGVALAYMLAGCPAVVANLWDVTDKDIDRFSESLLRTWLCDRSDQSVAAAVCKSREACRLRFLIGAAPVVYGLPVYLKEHRPYSL